MTDEQKTASGAYLDNFNLGAVGLWSVRLIITDLNGKSSTAYQQVYVGDANMNN